MCQRALVIAQVTRDLADGVFGIRLTRQQLGIALHVRQRLYRIGIAGFDLCVTEHIERRRKIVVQLNDLLHQFHGTIVVLLEIQPFCRQIECVAIFRKTRQKIVHRTDRVRKFTSKRSSGAAPIASCSAFCAACGLG